MYVVMLAGGLCHQRRNDRKNRVIFGTITGSKCLSVIGLCHISVLLSQNADKNICTCDTPELFSPCNDVVLHPVLMILVYR